MPWLKKKWLARTLKYSHRVIAVSSYTGNFINEKYGIDSRKIKVIPNGVDPERFYPKQVSGSLIAKYNLKDKFVLLTLARLEKRKGHDLVIRALGKLKNDFPELRYVIAGSDRNDYAMELKQLASDLDIHDRIIFSGFVKNDELIDFYNLSDIYLMTSRFLNKIGDSEGFGITFLEANACEKPVIGTRSGGIVDAIEDGFNGLLVNSDSVDDIVSSVVRLIKDPELRERLGKNGRKRILDTFNWASITKRILDTVP
jgi:phosphatidylinositol alpha-1,6-mannosyltransferase